MNLCLDVGNTHIFGGIYDNNKVILQFRYPSTSPCTSDQLGVFFKNVLQENHIKPSCISKVAICSVVPALNYSIRSAFLKYFAVDPFFLNTDSKFDLKIQYENIQEIGADRISSAIAATHTYAGKNIVVIDLGTATTFDVITADRVYLGGVIIPGIYISMKALSENTAKLSTVNIVKPENILGKNTAANIQSGLYYSHLGASREIIQRIAVDVFQNQPFLIIGTGGFAHLFENEALYDVLIPELVLNGLNIAANLN